MINRVDSEIRNGGQRPVNNIWGSFYSLRIVQSPKETNDIPAELKAGFQTSPTESGLSFRIAKKKGQHFIGIGGENLFLTMLKSSTTVAPSKQLRWQLYSRIRCEDYNQLLFSSEVRREGYGGGKIPSQTWRNLKWGCRALCTSRLGAVSWSRRQSYAPSLSHAVVHKVDVYNKLWGESTLSNSEHWEIKMTGPHRDASSLSRCSHYDITPINVAQRLNFSKKKRDTWQAARDDGNKST